MITTTKILLCGLIAFFTAGTLRAEVPDLDQARALSD